MSTTIRKVLDFPRIVRDAREKLDPLDAELAVIREINWQLNKLETDADVARCIRFVMEHRGFTLNDLKDDPDGN